MGDRCYVTVRVPHNQTMSLQEIKTILEGELDEPNQDDTIEGQPWEIWSWEEVNYGAGSFFGSLPELYPTLQLEAINGQGGDYGPGSILITGNPLQPLIEVGFEHGSDYPVVRVKPDGEAEEGPLNAARAYWRHVQRMFPSS